MMITRKGWEAGKLIIVCILLFFVTIAGGVCVRFCFPFITEAAGVNARPSINQPSSPSENGAALLNNHSFTVPFSLSDLQRHLKAEGYYTDKIDGAYGDNTKDAWARWYGDYMARTVSDYE